MNPKWKTDTRCVEMRNNVEEEMRILFPMFKRRDLLFICRQKSGKSPSEFYLEFKDLSLDCDLEKIGKESLLVHLLLRGLLSAKEKLREKIILEAKHEELQDSVISALISASEMYLSSSSKSAEMSRVESMGGNIKQREPSRLRGLPTCYSCNKEGHMRAECQEAGHCDKCTTETHPTKHVVPRYPRTLKQKVVLLTNLPQQIKARGKIKMGRRKREL